MEGIITIVGFLGAGKTTLLKSLIKKFTEHGFEPFIILNDYENANMDAQQLLKQIKPKWLRALSGSCICCSGLTELRRLVNTIPERDNGITLIEANGTSDACSLMGFLGIGIDERFAPPIQISVVDVKNWQTRKEHNELEKNQVQVSSVIVLMHTNHLIEGREESVIHDLEKINPLARIIALENVDISTITSATPSKNTPEKLDHDKAHWSSCSIDLVNLPSKRSIHIICNTFPSNILRVKGCALIGNDEKYTYFERTPDGEVYIRPFNGIPPMGAKLLIVGPGSNILLLKEAIKSALELDK